MYKFRTSNFKFLEALKYFSSIRYFDGTLQSRTSSLIKTIDDGLNKTSIYYRNLHNRTLCVKRNDIGYKEFLHYDVNNKIVIIDNKKYISDILLDDIETMTELELILKYGREILDESIVENINSFGSVNISLEHIFSEGLK